MSSISKTLPDGHYLITLNEIINSKYKVIKLLGQGTFGKVVKCINIETKELFAIKIIKNIEKYTKASEKEIKILQILNSSNSGFSDSVKLYETFTHYRHICMCFELLGSSIYDIQADKILNLSLSIDDIQNIARKLFQALKNIHSLGIVHSDIKPENVLFIDDTVIESRPRRSTAKYKVNNANKLRSSDVKLIDFGSAVFESDNHPALVSTRHYRAPEVVLGLGWSYEIDIWSVGCLLVELVIGGTLFQTHDNAEHLALMEKVTGKKINNELIERHLRKPKNEDLQLFKKNRINWPTKETEKDSVDYVKKVKCLEEKIKTKVKIMNEGSLVDWKFYNLFIDLCLKCLVYEPEFRISADEALEHEFFHVDTVDKVK